MKKEYIRKGIHTSLALLLALVAPIASKELLIGFAVLLFIVFSIARALRFFKIARVPRVTFGELFFAVGVLAAIQIAWPNIALFQVSMIVLALADPTAAIIGIPFGKHVYTVLDEKRSFEGSLACFVSAFVILFFFGVPLLYGLLYAFILSLIEAFSLRGSDNLTLPIATILLLSLA